MHPMTKEGIIYALVSALALAGICYLFLSLLFIIAGVVR